MRKLVLIVAAVPAVKWNVEQILVIFSNLSVDVDIIILASETELIKSERGVDNQMDWFQCVPEGHLWLPPTNKISVRGTTEQ